ncbi:MAG: hypothetical protein ABH844_07730 [Candidatus Omnitrophota bacterium]
MFKKVIKKLMSQISSHREIIALVATIVIASGAIVGPVITSKQFSQTIEHSDSQFEVMNRPYVEIRMTRKSFSVTPRFDNSTHKFNGCDIKFKYKLVNHGILPAKIMNIGWFFEGEDGKAVALSGQRDRKSLENVEVFSYKESLHKELDFIREATLKVDEIEKIVKMEDGFQLKKMEM